MIWLSAGCVAAAVCVVMTPAPRLPAVRATRAPGRLRPLAALGVGLGGWLLVGGALGVAVGGLAAFAAWRVLAAAEPETSRRERREVERTLPHLVSLFAATLRSGADPVVGLAQVCDALPGPAADRLRPVIDQVRWGSTGAEAWSELADDAALAPLGQALVRSQTSGASVVQIVERLAEDWERETLAAAEDAARRVGVAAAIPLGVCLLPAFLLLGVVPTAASLFSHVAP